MHKFKNDSKNKDSLKDYWNTPKEFYDVLNDVFSFDLDPCTEPLNRLDTPYFFTEKDNGLNMNWSNYSNIFINPPYSEIESWLIKAWNYCIIEKYDNNIDNIVFLIPASTGVKWFHKYIWDRQNGTPKHRSIFVYFMKRRLQFIHPEKDKKESAPFDTMLVIFTNDGLALSEKMIELFDDEGFIW